MTISINEHSVKLETASGETVEIALLGATVFSYKSKGVERLFKSTKSSIEGPSAIRGGIPICWPIFGPPPARDENFAKLKQHGFARTSLWSFNEAESSETSEGITAVFNFSSSPSTLELYNSPFHLTYTVNLTPLALSVSLHVTTSSTLSFQALLHTYVQLPASILPAQVTVTPFGGLVFVDKVQGGTRGREERAVVDVDGPKGEVDRVYLNSPDVLELNLGSGGRMRLNKKNLSDCVLWNPGMEKGSQIGDMEDGGASRYVCLEPGQVGEFVSLKAGETWEGSMILSFLD